MADTLTLWHVEHVNFGRLLDLLERQLASFERGDSPDYELMLEIMYYMTHYSDVLHHPKEDLVFARIRERDANACATIDRLSGEHATLKRAGQELVQELDGVLDGSIMSRKRIDAAGRAYLAMLREHMRVEETEILPLAARLLGPSDWASIDAAIRQFHDPLFGTRTERRYAGLARHIRGA
ncbi:MAG TPA: hemerythrin domain-containing protein [Casimicrobiaceae bacterium]|nr:hemerythrin domain-containing protein [Casimicrobiaceae bacterium]